MQSRDDDSFACRRFISLFGVTPENFVQEYWPDRLLVHEGPVERLGDIGGLVKVSDISALLSMPRRALSVQFPTKTAVTGYIPNTDVRTAMLAYESGCQIYVHLNPTDGGPFQDFFRQIKLALGVPVAWGEVGVYATKHSGPATGLHFDGNENIMVQLSGEKVWRVAPNASVPYAPKNFVAGGSMPARSDLRPPAIDWPSLAEAPFPERMPDGATAVVMKPGSIAYIPRGYWHETEASEGGSISAACTWDSPTVGEVVLSRLLALAIRNSKWRRPVAMVAPGDLSFQREVTALTEFLEAIPRFLDEFGREPGILLRDLRRLREFL